MPPILIYTIKGVLRFIQASAGESCDASSLLWLDRLTVPFAVSLFVPFSYNSHFLPFPCFLRQIHARSTPGPQKNLHDLLLRSPRGLGDQGTRQSLRYVQACTSMSYQSFQRTRALSRRPGEKAGPKGILRHDHWPNAAVRIDAGDIYLYLLNEVL